ncbi:MAG: 50S ribosomal protein L16 [Candidatus Aenigmarchaeota archaeon]|nr:50S ribosomal protein L16 [Candidatus Aenigmarchaeota archaeon]
MGLRPARCYRTLKRAYTRFSRANKSKDYVKGIPESKIHRFEFGNAKRPYQYSLCLTVRDTVQIRHNALEACRVSLNKNLDKRVGTDAYFGKVLVYPHQILREKMLATGAGADRFQSGMRLAFGKPIGTAARVYSGQSVVEVRVDEAGLEAAKKSMHIAGSKLPCPSSILVKRIAG